MLKVVFFTSFFLILFLTHPPTQFMDHRGWYDCTDCSFKLVQDVVIVAAMGPPGGGRNPVSGACGQSQMGADDSIIII